MKKLNMVLLVIGLISLCGCSSKNVQSSSSEVTVSSNAESAIEPIPELEDTQWEIVSVTAEDFGMQGGLENPAFVEVGGNPAGAPLDKLIAFCLSADTLSEEAYEELYQRFLEAPNAVLSYCSLMGEQTVELTGQGKVPAAEYICEMIGQTDKTHGLTDEFAQVVETARQAFPKYTGNAQILLTRIELGRGTFGGN
ncbi:hypothetical protein [Oscillibacter sp.]|uniref:hypothetical protein n=1 Tax=Oscillibacter sp. TaxID=1945593 RepID=UPI00261122AD|nr:hypothetical protein [Oscillibacter sp.]MDD3347271.1 hypothetical protein [Oscillibacter sp.]